MTITADKRNSFIKIREYKCSKCGQTVRVRVYRMIKMIDDIDSTELDCDKVIMRKALK